MKLGDSALKPPSEKMKSSVENSPGAHNERLTHGGIWCKIDLCRWSTSVPEVGVTEQSCLLKTELELKKYIPWESYK